MLRDMQLFGCALYYSASARDTNQQAAAIG